jgi:hypothetical protein
MRAYVPNEQGWICSLLHKVRLGLLLELFVVELFVVKLFVTSFVLSFYIFTLHPTRLPLYTGKVIKPRLLGTTNMQKIVVSDSVILCVCSD